MKSHRVVRISRQGAGRNLPKAVQIAALGLLLAATVPLSAQEKQEAGTSGSGKGSGSIGFIASKDAGAKEVGLPLYPGSRPHPEKSDDSPAFQLGLWGGTWGFKLVGLKIESSDPPEKIAAFYHKALAKYGKVWNCADSAQAAGDQKKAASDDMPDCKDEHPESGETVLQAGTKERKHLVDIKPEGKLSVIQLLYIEAPASDGK